MGYVPPPPPPPDDPPGWTPVGGLPDEDIKITPVADGYLIERKVRPTPSIGTIYDTWPWWVYWAIVVLILAFVAALVILLSGGAAF